MPETTDWKQKYRGSVAEMQAEETRWRLEAAAVLGEVSSATELAALQSLVKTRLERVTREVCDFRARETRSREGRRAARSVDGPRQPQVLRRVAACFKAAAHRGCDLTARIGGEEFATLLDGIRAEEALQIANDVRSAVEGLRFHFRGSRLRLRRFGALPRQTRRQKRVHRRLSAIPPH